jgi:phosphomannomutase
VELYFRVLLKCFGRGGSLVQINCEPTGHFAHNPEPLAEHLTETCDISPTIAKWMCAFVTDPDVDRLAIISEDGTLFNEEYTLGSGGRLCTEPYTREYRIQSVIEPGTAEILPKNTAGHTRLPQWVK